MENQIFTHNGIFTVKSVATGAHRTFKITTPRKGKLAGRRLVGVLVGSNNSEDYLFFGFVDSEKINVWKSQQGMAALAKMLEKLPQYEAVGAVEVTALLHCRCCNRALTTPNSLALGIGPECAKRK